MGDKNLTISDIANELGVSKTTVSRVISGKGRISEATRLKVQEYIELHKYRPNVIARSLAQSKTFNIGVVLPADSNLTEIPFFQSCLMGICDVAVSFEYDVVVTITTEEDISQLKRIVQKNKVDGIILTRITTNDLATAYLKENHIPFVVIGSSEDAEVIQIDNNHVDGCTELTSILIQYGYHRIALLGGNPRHIVNMNRYEGFIKAFQDSKRIVDENLIHMNLTSKVMIERTVDLMIDQGIDCIVCTDDFICSQVLARINEKGYIIPKDIKVASFYDSVYLDNYNPPVTCLRIDVKSLGIEAGKCLINLISQHEVAQKTLLDYELVLKKSTM